MSYISYIIYAMLTCHSVKGQSRDSSSNSSMEKSCQPDDFCYDDVDVVDDDVDVDDDE